MGYDEYKLMSPPESDSHIILCKCGNTLQVSNQGGDPEVCISCQKKEEELDILSNIN